MKISQINELSESTKNQPLSMHDVPDSTRSGQEKIPKNRCQHFLWTTTIIVGSGTMMTNNMAQMGEARGFSSSGSAHCLALFSVAQALARIGIGEVSERALLWDTNHFGIDSGVPRNFFVVLASLMAVIGHAVLAAAATRPAFVVGVILSGFSFGSIWPLMILIIADVFGTTSHGSNYIFYDGFTSAFGTLIISKCVVQSVYETHIDPQVDETVCYGAGCFRGSQVIVAGLCITC